MVTSRLNSFLVVLKTFEVSSKFDVRYIFVSVWNCSFIQYVHTLSCLVLYRVALSTI